MLRPANPFPSANTPRNQQPYAQQPKKVYYLADARATHLVFGGRSQPVTDDIRDNGVAMTDDEAAMYLANGTLTNLEAARSKRAEAARDAASGENPIGESEAEGQGGGKRKRRG